MKENGVMRIAAALGIAIGLVLPVDTEHDVSAQPLSGEREFVVFDATSYRNKPDLVSYGISPIMLLYAGQFGSDWFKDQERLPNRSSVEEIAKGLNVTGKPVVLDIEHWPLNGGQERVRGSVMKYIQVLKWFRETAPSVPVGYYGAPPLRDYWRAVKPPQSGEHRAWLEENDRIAALADAVDMLFPSLYTFYADQEGWKTYAKAQIQEARRLGKGKPVFVFLWPQYHESNRQLGGRYISSEFWTLQLQTARELADGLIIWSGREEWNEEAPWWEATKAFMRTLRSVSRSVNPAMPNGR
ncbi:MAG TPA: hypothetical protein VJ746_04470 [Nitrospira sp.]|nr:hypothetical protein [Nitrospira sp.]